MASRADRIEVELRLRDLASSEMKAFGKSVDRTSKAAVKDLARMDKSTSKVSAGLGKMAGAAAAVYAAFAAGRVAVGAGFGFVQAASDFEESFSKFSVVFGKEAGRVDKELDAITKTMGRSKADFVNYTSSFQDLLVPMGFTRKEAADMSVSLSALAVDVGSFSNAADADVIDDFKSALIGSSETVAKYGIIAKEANVQSEAYALGIAEVGSKLTDQQKVQARVALLFKGTTDAQGDAIRTSASWSNQLKRLKADVNAVSTEVGSNMITALQDGIEELGGMDRIVMIVQGAIRVLGAGLIAGIKALVSIGQAAITFVKSFGPVEKTIVSVVGFIAEFNGAIRQGINALTALGGIAGAVFTAVGEFAVKGIEPAISAINGLIDGFNAVSDLVGGPTIKNVALGFEVSTKTVSEILANLKDDGASVWDDYTTGIGEARAETERLKGLLLTVATGGSIAAPEAAEGPAAEDPAISSELAARIVKFTKFGISEAKRLATGRKAIAEEAAAAALAAEAEYAFKVMELQRDLANAAIEERGRRAAEELAATELLAAQKLEAEAEYAMKLMELQRDLTNASIAEADKKREADAAAAAETERLSSAYEGAKSGVEAYAASLSDFRLGQDLAVGAFGALEGGLDDISRQLVEGKADFGTFAKSVIKDIGAMVIKFLLLKAVKGALGIGADGGIGGGLLGAIGFAEGGVVPGGIGVGGKSLDVGAFASGGVVTRPTLGLVGEGASDEAIIPLSKGRKVGVEMKGGGGGATTNNITIRVESLDPERATEVIGRSMPFIRQQISASLASGDDRKLIQSVKGAR